MLEQNVGHEWCLIQKRLTGSIKLQNNIIKYITNINIIYNDVFYHSLLKIKTEHQKNEAYNNQVNNHYKLINIIHVLIIVFNCY